jgi:hypothetical protein
LRKRGRQPQDRVGFRFLCGADQFVDELGGHEEAEGAAERRGKQTSCRISAFALVYDIEEDIDVEHVDWLLTCADELRPGAVFHVSKQRWRSEFPLADVDAATSGDPTLLSADGEKSCAFPELICG